jgi:hypothetical protein
MMMMMMMMAMMITNLLLQALMNNDGYTPALALPSLHERCQAVGVAGPTLLAQCSAGWTPRLSGPVGCPPSPQHNTQLYKLSQFATSKAKLRPVLTSIAANSLAVATVTSR